MIQAQGVAAGAAEGALTQLLDVLGLSADAAGGPVTIAGGDYPQVSPLRLATTNAAAMAAHALAVGAYFRLRGGQEQSIHIDTVRALQHLRSFFYLLRDGNPITVELSNSVSGFYRTADERWILVYGHGHFHDTALGVLQAPDSLDAVTATIARWQSGALEDAMAARRIPVAIVRSEAEWLAHAQGRWLAARPVIDIERIGDSAPEIRPLPKTPQAAARPLAGLRVLDLTHVICGPMVSRFLGEHGADVLRVIAPDYEDLDIVALDCGWGKRTGRGDFRRAADMQQLRALAAEADVVVQSYRPGALDRHGLSAVELARLRPGLVYVSVSCFGTGGPWGERGGYDPVAQSASGMAHTEALDGVPRQSRTLTVNDYLNAYLGAAGAVTALLRRAREGGSYHVRVALTRSAMWLQSQGLLADASEHVHLPYADPASPQLITRDTPFGKVTSLRPGVAYSATPAEWPLPPSPTSAGLPEWRPRDA